MEISFVGSSPPYNGETPGDGITDYNGYDGTYAFSGEILELS